MWIRPRPRMVLIGPAGAAAAALTGCSNTVDGTAVAAGEGSVGATTSGSVPTPPERTAAGAATDCASLSAVIAPLVPAVSDTPQDVPGVAGTTMCVWTGSRGAAVSVNVTAKDVDPEIIALIRDDDSAVTDERVAALGAVALRTVGVGLQTPTHLISVVVAAQEDTPDLDLDVAVAIAESLRG